MERHTTNIACNKNPAEVSIRLAQAHFDAGRIHLDTQAWPQAMAAFKKSLDLKPDCAEAALGLATALRKSGSGDKAIIVYRMALEIDPDLAAAHYGKGICQLITGDPTQAVLSLERAVTLEPRNARSWFHKAEAHMLLEDSDAAIACYIRAIGLRPGWDAAHYNIAVALRMAERLEESIRHARQVLRINPDHSKVVPLLFRLAQHTCDWPMAESMSRRLDALNARDLAGGRRTSEPPLTSIRRKSDVKANMLVARSWSRHLVDRVRGQMSPPATGFQVGRRRRIRIGYLSSDFRDHAVAYQIRGLLEKHDRNGFVVHGYACNPDDGSPYRRRMAAACDRFHEVHARDNASIASQIRNDGIQILVDMAGHSRGNRLGIAAMHPAPVQVSYLGFLSTTGADFFDYVLADPIVVPPDHARYYTESVAYLPHCYQANDDCLAISRNPQRRERWRLPASAFVFCSFNQPYKIDAPLFASWMSILRRVPRSVLWLVERSPLARDNLCRAARQAHVDPARLIFSGFVPLEQNLSRLRLADLVLDTVLHNGGATTANALWAGVPVLTVLGSHWVSRMSASALNAVDLWELVTVDLAAYEDLAVELARNPARLANLRLRLRDGRRTAPLFRTERFVRYVESAYHHMWERWVKGLPAESFHIAP